MHWIARQYIKKGIVSATSCVRPPCLNYFIIEQTCNAVAPALIANTVMFSEPTVAHRVCGVLAFAFSLLMSCQDLVPVGRFGQPEEVAQVVELLVTNSYMTDKVGDLGVSAYWVAHNFVLAHR